MTPDDITNLNHIKINKCSSFCDFCDYMYRQHVTCTTCINNKFMPHAIQNSCSGIYLIDYTKIVKLLIDNPNSMDARTNFNYFIVENRNKPDLSRFNIYYIRNITIERAQEIINANVAAFTQYNNALVEKDLIDAINEI